MAVQYADEEALQGTIYSGKSGEFSFATPAGGEFGPVEGVVKSATEATRKRKTVYAARRDGRPSGRTAGKFEPGSITVAMLRNTAQAFETWLAGQGAGSFGDPEFTYVVSLFEPDINATAPITATYDRCVIAGKKTNEDEGIEELVTEYTIEFLDSDENGNVLWSTLRTT
jgi:hypothetical protein